MNSVRVVPNEVTIGSRAVVPQLKIITHKNKKIKYELNEYNSLHTITRENKPYWQIVIFVT